MILEKILPMLLGTIVAMSLSGCAAEQNTNATVTEMDSTLEEEKVKENAPASTTNDPVSEEVNVLANDEKIIEMLKKSGVIAEDASPEEINQALEKYLKGKAEDNQLKEKSSEKYIEDLKKQIQKDLSKEN
ncbi:MAG: hypothetical protein WBV93_02395 [Anaerobacillus sp.]